MEKILARVCTVFALCCCTQGSNITYHPNKTTWKEAVEYCANRGGILYSDEADIRNRTSNEPYNTDNVWTGKYQAFSPWAISWGCYRVNFGDNSKEIFSVPYGEQPECQKICAETDFFAVKENICKCLHLTEVDERRKENINPCTCSTCVSVLRHRIENVRTRSNGCPPENTRCTCMAASCIENKLILTPEVCDQYYGVVCENKKKTTSHGQETAISFCYTENSILRLFTNTKDICELGLAHHWTSGIRSLYQYKVKYKDEASNLNPLRCVSVIKNIDRGSEPVDCGDMLPFYCKMGGNIDEEDTLLNKGSQNNSDTGAIAGTVFTILTLLLICGTGIFIYKRRITSKESQKNTIHIETKNGSDGQYQENEIDSSLAKPSSSNQEPTNNTEGDINEYTRIDSSAFQIQNRANISNNAVSNRGYNDIHSKDKSNHDNNFNMELTNPDVDKMNVSEYALAQPFPDKEELDPYTTDTDYDHLNNVKKQEMSDMKVYDHLKNVTESDPTYDHAGVTVRGGTDNYEHFNVEK